MKRTEPTEPVREHPVETEGDIVRVRRVARELAEEIGLGLVPTTKLVTACSELARNMLEHAGGGVLRARLRQKAGRRGVELVFEDHGPGIPDVARALRDGYSSGRGLGLGLGGSRRLVDELTLDTEPGEGTTVRICSWE
jgi:serine/threonine-protein kinase RsbT